MTVTYSNRVMREWFGQYAVQDDTLTLVFTGVNVKGGRRGAPILNWSRIAEHKDSPRRMRAAYVRAPITTGGDDGN